MLTSYFLDVMDPGAFSSVSAMSREVLAQLRQPPGHAQRIKRLVAKRAAPTTQRKIRGFPLQLCEVVAKYCLQQKSFEDVCRLVNADLQKLCDVVPGLWVDFQRNATQTGWEDFKEPFIRNVAGYCGIRLLGIGNRVRIAWVGIGYRVGIAWVGIGCVGIAWVGIGCVGRRERTHARKLKRFMH